MSEPLSNLFFWDSGTIQALENHGAAKRSEYSNANPLTSRQAEPTRDEVIARLKALSVNTEAIEEFVRDLFGSW